MTSVGDALESFRCSFGLPWIAAPSSLFNSLFGIETTLPSNLFNRLFGIGFAGCQVAYLAASSGPSSSSFISRLIGTQTSAPSSLFRAYLGRPQSTYLRATKGVWNQVT